MKVLSTMYTKFKAPGLCFVAVIVLASCSNRSEKQISDDYNIAFGKVSKENVFISDTMSIWGGSIVKGEDGLFHMFYSRWPKSMGWAWVTDSEVAHAISDSPLGPFKFKEVALERRGVEYWDGWCTHNPTIHKFDNKYYLYYMGNTGDGLNPNGQDKSIEKLNFVHRNNQRIGVAVADSPDGPWKRFDEPLIDVSEDSLAHDALMTSNPSIARGPDGKFILIYKAVGKKSKMPFGGPVVHMVAVSDSPTGPFKKYPDPVFAVEGAHFPAEDPYIWYGEKKFRAIVKRIEINETDEGRQRIFSLVNYESKDGITWKPSDNHVLSERAVTWKNGREQQFLHLERPQVYFEDGLPKVLACAGDTLDDLGVRQTFNIQIPLIVKK